MSRLRCSRFGGAAVCLLACSAPPPDALDSPIVALELRELVRFGSIDGSEELQFSQPGQLVVDPAADRVYVPDHLTGEIKVFDRAGSFLHGFGGSGQGPGEFDGSPVLAAARDTVVVLDRSRIHLFRPEGTLLGTSAFDPTFMWPLPLAVTADSAGWVAWTMETHPYERDTGTFERFYRIDATDRRKGPDLLFEIWHDESAMGILSEQQRAYPVENGFVMAPGPTFELLSFPDWASSPDTLRFSAAPVGVRRDAFERYASARLSACAEVPAPERCRERMRTRISRMESRPIPDMRPVIGGLLGSRDGLVLVLRADLDPDPFVPFDEARWDLVHSDGRMVGELTMPPGFSPRWLGGDELWGFFQDELDVPYVVGYRILGIERTPE